MTRRLVASLCVVLFLLVSDSAAQTGSTPFGQQVTINPGDSGSTQFGDLMILYRLDSTAQNMTCTFYLSAAFVGIRVMTKKSTVFLFKYQQGASKASGTLTMNLDYIPQVSTLSADFTYTNTPNNQTSTFTGDLIGWYIRP